MNTLARTTTGRFAPAPRRPHWLTRWQRWAAQQRARRELAELDPRTLRDIGLSPSEIDSVVAEVQGRVQATRRIAMQPLDRQWSA